MSFKTDGNSIIDDKESKIWYHGSPYEIEVLKTGSSVTRNKQLAIAFSHKPTQLSVNDDGTIIHNGSVKGYLYSIDEEIEDNNLKVHQACEEKDPWEWITKREYKLKLIKKTDI